MPSLPTLKLDKTGDSRTKLGCFSGCKGDYLTFGTFSRVVCALRKSYQKGAWLSEID